MSFLNKKEQVISVRLTRQGKRQLAEGKLDAKYYAFLDDDILYDSEYAFIREEQNESVPRIKSTQRLEGAVSLGLTENEPELLIHGTLGTSSPMAEYAPAWSLKLLEGQITGGIVYDSSSIPQVTVNIREYQNKSGEIEDINSLVIMLEELNGLYTLENFDIEVFEVGQGDELRQLEFSNDMNANPNTVEYYFDIFTDKQVDMTGYSMKKTDQFLDDLPAPEPKQDC